MDTTTYYAHGQEIDTPEYWYLEEYLTMTTFIYHLWISIVMFGLVSNTVNILTFTRMGLRDNVTTTLLCLSVSDFLFLIIRSMGSVGRFMTVNVPDHPWPFHPHILILGTFWYSYVFYDYSTFISVFLAVVRCACVAKPLLFKSMFTKARTVAVLCILFLVAVILHIPDLTVFRLTWVENPRTNSTFRSVAFAENFREIYKASDIVNRNILSWLTYITVIVCVGVLTSKIQAASKFRQSLAVQTFNTAIKNTTNQEEITISQSSPPSTITKINSKTSQRGKDSEKTSAKDLQVIQSVVLICVIFIFSQMPFQVVSTVRLIDPEFSDTGSRVVLYGLVAHASNTLSLLNASINIFVYYNYNTKYREQFQRIFCFTCSIVTDE